MINLIVSILLCLMVAAIVGVWVGVLIVGVFDYISLSTTTQPGENSLTIDYTGLDAAGLGTTGHCVRPRKKNLSDCTKALYKAGVITLEEYHEAQQELYKELQKAPPKLPCDAKTTLKPIRYESFFQNGRH